MGMIKLINYIRSEVVAGRTPNISTDAGFQHERYLKPVLEDDALLYSLHDIIGEGFDYEHNGQPEALRDCDHDQGGHNEHQIRELEDRLRRTRQELDSRKQELEAIRAHFGASLYHEPEESNTYCDKASKKPSAGECKNAVGVGNTDRSYFESYSGHGTLPAT